jgi:type IV secretory pathway TrbD component
MNGEGQRLTVIHPSLVRPVLLAGAERPLAIANWITAAALILGGGHGTRSRSGRCSRPVATRC